MPRNTRKRNGASVRVAPEGNGTNLLGGPEHEAANTVWRKHVQVLHELNTMLLHVRLLGRIHLQVVVR